MFEWIRWMQQGVTLYLDNAARYFQPIAPQIRVPVWLMVSLSVILITSFLASEIAGYQSWQWAVSTLGVGGILVWIGMRVIFKYPPDDWGAPA